MATHKIKVLIADDSQVARDLLTFILGADAEIDIVGEAKNGDEIFKWLKEQGLPDVIVLDLFMPGLDGFEISRRIMETTPVPVVIISSGYSQVDVEKSFKAIEAGALAILEKPYNIHDTFRIRELIETVRMINGAKLVRRRPNNAPAKVQAKVPLDRKELLSLKPSAIHAIAIGASLGGPVAVEKILAALPASMPVPLFLVQHISKGFTKGFADWLQKTCALYIKLGEQGESVQPGTLYIAPDDCHMLIKDNYTIALDYKDNSHLKPGINQLFTSVAHVYGTHAIGALLTGMGRDGAEGLLKMRQQGAYTIAQDEKSCVIFGMPKEAIEIGAARYILPLERIADVLISLSKANYKD